MRKNGGRQKLKALLIVSSCLICALPLAVRVIGEHKVVRNVKEYESEESEKVRKKELAEDLAAAEEYNRRLTANAAKVVGFPESLKSPYEDGEIIGTLKIPEIYAELPIIMGTDKSILYRGAGLLYGSSIPVGGKGCHAILTGHTGLPAAAMFTRLDELKKGDIFTVETCGRTLTYKVADISVVEPDADIADFKADEDKVSLVTCTPYGINTHRLVVTGKREKETGASGNAKAGEGAGSRGNTDSGAGDGEKTGDGSASGRAPRLSTEEVIMTLLACAALAVGVWQIIMSAKGRFKNQA